MLREVGRKAQQQTGSSVLAAVDHMDDGTPIALKVLAPLELRLHTTKSRATLHVVGSCRSASMLLTGRLYSTSRGQAARCWAIATRHVL
jgi:hypothetical protein